MGDVVVKETTQLDSLYAKTIDMIGTLANQKVVKVDREEFLRSVFNNSEYLDDILTFGPQKVFTIEGLRIEAEKIIKESTNRTSVTSFVSGLPGNPLAMVALGGADVVQYFGFALNMAQKIAYLYGEENLIDEGSNLSEESKIRIVSYLGVMFGAAGATKLIGKTSVKVGETLGKNIASRALTKTAWYPLVKRTGAMIGVKITKKSVEKAITKAVPVIGGVVSGGITYLTFKPMGRRLVKVFENHIDPVSLDKDYLHPQFIAQKIVENEDIVDADFELVENDE